MSRAEYEFANRVAKAGKIPSPRTTRRKGIIFSGLLVLMPLGVIEGIHGIVRSTQWSNNIDTFNENYPQLSKEIRLHSAQYDLYEDIKSDANDKYSVKDILTEDEDVSLNKVVDQIFKPNSPEFVEIRRDHQIFQNWLEKRNETAHKKHGSRPNEEVIGFGLSILGMIPLAYLARKSVLIRAKRNEFPADQAWNLSRTLIGIEPSWLEHPPSKNELRKLLNAFQLLPPIGGKVIPFTEGGKEGITLKYDPHHLAEQHAKIVNTKKNQDELGKLFIHQLTVQGKLPDSFKYAALTLILNSPYASNWNQPFFKSPWGTVAPLVHDGGNVRTKFNKKWGNVPGRTDFIQRIFIKKTSDALNEQEDLRMITEAMFYQRAALALHCHANNELPKGLTAEMKQALAEKWQLFETQIQELLVDYGIDEASNLPWFLETPRYLWGGQPPRYEADYQPIQEALINLEEVKKEHSHELQRRTTEIMIQTTKSVDAIIGFDRLDLVDVELDGGTHG